MHGQRLLLILSATSFILAAYLIFSGLNLLAPTDKKLNPTPDLLIPTPTISQTLGEQTETLYFVNKVIDGDTFEIDGGERVRMIGIDTPETVDPRRPVGCFGPEASAMTKELLEGKMVVLVSDTTDRDKYQRLLRYVYLNGVFVQEFLTRNGFAKSYPYPPDVKYQGFLDAAEIEAKSNKQGLWGSCF